MSKRNRIQEAVELAWQTYEVHMEISLKLEIIHQSSLVHHNDFIKYNLNPTKVKKNYIKKRLSKSFANLFNSYKNVIDSVSDLINLYENEPLEIPSHRVVNLQHLVELKNINSTLIEQMKIQRNFIFEDLN